MSIVFEELDFEPFEHPLSSTTAYRRWFGPHEVQAVVFTNRWFRDGYILSGIVNTGRTIGSVEVELPIEVDSRELGLALVSYFLREEIPEIHKPPWLRIGERMGSHLPWRNGV